MALLQECLGQARAGSGRTVLVEGEAGIGKTRLIHEFLDVARANGFAIHTARAEEHEFSPPFAPLIDALHSAGSIEKPRPPIRGNPPGDRLEVSELKMLEEILAEVDELSSRGPLVLAIEDLQWADRSTVRALHSIARRSTNSPVLVVLSARPAPRSSNLAALVHWLVDAGHDRIAVGPLDEDNVRRLAEATAGAGAGARLLRHLGGAAGNPLYITELVTSLLREGQVEAGDDGVELVDDSLPSSLRATLLRRLSTLTAPTIEVLRTASLLGSTFSAQGLAIALDRSARELAAPLREAQQHHVIVETGTELAFRHDLIREAIYEEIPRSVRRALHVEVAEALAAAGVPSAQVARHYAAGADVGDATAVQWLWRAGTEHAAHAPAVAVDLFRYALRLLPAVSPERDAITVDLLRPLIDSGSPGEAAALAREVLSHGHSPDVQARVARLLSHAELVQGDLLEAQAALDRVLTLGSLAAYDRAAVLADRANLAFDPDSGVRRCRDALAAADASGNPHARVRALTALGPRLEAVTEAQQVAEAAVEAARRLPSGVSRDSEALYLLGDALFCRGSFLFRTDRFEEADPDLRSALAIAVDIGAVAYVPIIYNEIVVGLWYSGQWDDALAEAETGLALADEIGVATEVSGLLAKRALIHLHRDQLDLAAEALLRAEPLPPPANDTAGSWRLTARAFLLEVEGRHEEALAAYEEGARSPWRVTDAADAVRLSLALGRLDRAQSAADAVAAAAAPGRGPFVDAVALLCRGMVDRDVDALSGAVESLRRSRRPLFLARACEEAARVSAANGDLAATKSFALEAVALYSTLDARWDLGRVDALLRGVGVRRGARETRRRPAVGWDSLTPTERRVVALVREGLTNSAIGERMFISHRTVSTHLTHIFAKLGVSSRGELVAMTLRDGRD